MTDASFYRKTEEYYNFASSLSETHSIRKTLKTNKTIKAIKSISSFKHQLNVLQELALTSLLILVLLAYTISNRECRSQSAEEIFNNRAPKIFNFPFSLPLLMNTIPPPPRSLTPKGYDSILH